MSDVIDFDLAQLLDELESRETVKAVEDVLYAPEDDAIQKIVEEATRKRGSKWTTADKLEFIRLMDEVEKRKDFSGHLRYFPEDGPLGWRNYRRHVRFCNAGRDYIERLFMAGNRTGKTLTGAFEVACHATGQYPDWWEGHQFDHPVDIWVAGKTNQTTRDVIQKELLGPPGAQGTGMIAKDLIVRTATKAGVPGGIEFMEVIHAPTGKSSYIGFKSYDQGRKSFEGTAKHVIWLDEEPPSDVYSECLLRTMISKESPKGGIMFTTFTPLEGWTKFIIDFTNSCDSPIYGPGADLSVHRGDSPNVRLMVRAGVNHAPHLDQEAVEARLRNLPEHEQKARREGTPAFGQGLIYQVPEEEYVIEPIKRQPFWKKCYALDVGWNKTAALWFAWDEDNDIVYVYREYYKGYEKPEYHAQAIKYGYPSKGTVLRGVIDPASRGRTQTDGTRLIDEYRKLGLKITPADNQVEAGIYMVLSRLATGRLKVFNTCQSFLQEIRMYQRDQNGKPLKQDDHLMDCLRYGIMSGLRIARPDSIDKVPRGRGARQYGV